MGLLAPIRRAIARIVGDVDVLKLRLDTAIARPEYQRGWEKWPDGREKTFCNLMAWYLLDNRLPLTKYGPFVGAYVYNLIPILRDGVAKNITNTTIDVAYDRVAADLRTRKFIDKAVSPQKAQELANRGIPVMAICKRPKWAHVAIVYPDSEHYDSKRGPKMAQAGWVNGVMYINNPFCWGAEWKGKGIIFAVFKKYGKRGV
jgi:hypothetical protein